ncbi:bifunctional D-glycero-beta-D-manno-heptose-7-phosphate kinase/D-glycero-beta-D-manno-heptose 1-phosphate adenylyltransferase HldE [Gammaproteobacteria bacterium]|nr:bifunctional D-glycero-beta-D-manno-heptose-7-phosphate kinase/D-glycero-beta-D-manno-heptose 1-phosphate adenylyltransferase HldE [Gammaproteobacteria bacterium]
MNLDLLKKANVLVIGDIILDKYIYGSVDRVSPESPVPVLRPESEESRLGGAANVASNISSLGSKVSLQGVIGRDEAAEGLKALLKEKKVKGFFSTSSLPTISKLRLLASRQQLLRIDVEEKFSIEDWSKTKALFSKIISSTKATVIVVSDYDKGTLRDIPFLIKQAAKKNIYTLIDPKGNDFSKYEGANIITPNYLEFSNAVGGVLSESDLTLKAKNLIEDLKLEALLITRGAEGMTLVEKQKDKMMRTDFSTLAQEVFDVSGAGDTVIASLAASIASGFNLSDSVRISNVAAGIVVGKSGTATPRLSELEASFKTNADSFSKAQLKLICKEAKEDSLKVVFTNGCFDILHAGHLSYLEAAKKLGDKLIVGINNDSSVSKLKGKGRPINPLEERMALIQALKCVDYVVSFSEDTPLKLIEFLKPNVLVKGADYKVKDIVGSESVIKDGGEVRTIPLVKGLSSSRKIQKIKGS